MLEMNREDFSIERAMEMPETERESWDLNFISLRGCFSDDFKYSHQVRGEKFYKNVLFVPRKSGNMDQIPVVFFESLLDELRYEQCIGRQVGVEGKVHSRNYVGEDGKKHLQVFVSANSISLFDKYLNCSNNNLVWLNGYACSYPTFRTTPFGREISDLFVYVNRQYNQRDYIPCIAWGSTAVYAFDNVEPGDKVSLVGRLQSRNYVKRFSEVPYKCENKTVYEVSLMRLDKL